MTKILDRLPISEKRTAVQFGDKYVTFHRNQIVVWVSIDWPGSVEPAVKIPKFPALLDTGNNFDFSIPHRQLRDWARIDVGLLPLLGDINIDGRMIGRYQATVWLFRNRPGQREISNEKPPVHLTMENGVAVYPKDESFLDPRLPLLGLPALLNNSLDLLIDSDRRHVNVHTRSWRRSLIRFLSRI